MSDLLLLFCLSLAELCTRLLGAGIPPPPADLLEGGGSRDALGFLNSVKFKNQEGNKVIVTDEKFQREPLHIAYKKL